MVKGRKFIVLSDFRIFKFGFLVMMTILDGSFFCVHLQELHTRIIYETKGQRSFNASGYILTFLVLSYF